MEKKIVWNDEWDIARYRIYLANKTDNRNVNMVKRHGTPANICMIKWIDKKRKPPSVWGWGDLEARYSHTCMTVGRKDNYHECLVGPVVLAAVTIGHKTWLSNSYKHAYNDSIWNNNQPYLPFLFKAEKCTFKML